jgi:hypothetical protein
MTHWLINGLQMFEKIWDLLRSQSRPHTTIRDTNSAITGCALATTFALFTSNNGDSATDQTASEGETSSVLSSRYHDNDSEASEAESYIARAILILKPLATQGTFRCDFKSNESSRY